MRVLLCTVCLFASLLVSKVYCQEDEKDIKASWWDRLVDVMENFFKRLKDLWSEFKDEIHERTKDIRDWSSEIFTGFKEKMNDWINKKEDASESEKMEMRRYVERLKMPEKGD